MKSKSLILLTLLILLNACQNKPLSVKPEKIIDCHVHLWDTRRPEGISWPRPEHKKLYRPYLPQHIIPIAQKNNVKGIVAIQSGQTIGDNQWNLDIIENEPLFKGVIGNMSRVIGTDKYKPLLDELSKNRKYLGFRLSGKYEKELSKAFFRDLKLAAEKGLAIDILIGNYTLKDVAQIAQEVPNLRIMVDHLGGVKLDGKPLAQSWKEDFQELGKYKNVFCKVSALYARSVPQPASQNIDFYREVLDLAYEIFGEDRLAYSSDWPCTERVDDYTSVVVLTNSFLKEKGPKVSDKVFYENALNFYKVPGLE